VDRNIRQLFSTVIGLNAIGLSASAFVDRRAAMPDARVPATSCGTLAYFCAAGC